MIIHQIMVYDFCLRFCFCLGFCLSLSLCLSFCLCFCFSLCYRFLLTKSCLNHRLKKLMSFVPKD